jgi:hypothetical protein
MRKLTSMLTVNKENLKCQLFAGDQAVTVKPRIDLQMSEYILHQVTYIFQQKTRTKWKQSLITQQNSKRTMRDTNK